MQQNYNRTGRVRSFHSHADFYHRHDFIKDGFVDNIIDTILPGMGLLELNGIARGLEVVK